MWLERTQGCGSSMLLLLPAWVLCTFLASLAGGKFVQASLDCLTPATLAQAATVLLYLLGVKWPSNGKHDKNDCRTASMDVRRLAVLALGVLQVLSSMLTLGSFGLAGVSETYIVRALEPICSCVLSCLLHKRRTSARELVLVSVVVGAIWCVVSTQNTSARGVKGPGASTHTMYHGAWSCQLPLTGDQPLEPPQLWGDVSRDCLMLWSMHMQLCWSCITDRRGHSATSMSIHALDSHHGYSGVA